MRAIGVTKEHPPGQALRASLARAGAMIAERPFARWAIELVRRWREEQVSRLSAALSFYALLSLIPLLITSDALLGLILEQKTIARFFEMEAASLIGPQQAAAVSEMLNHARSTTVMSWQALIGGLVTFVAAAGVFIELKAAMNGLWNVPPAVHSTWWRTISSYFAPMSMVLGFGFLLLISLVVGALVSAATATLANWQPALAVGLTVGDWLVSWLVAFLLFAAIFRFFPDTTVHWRQVLLGAVVTAGLHTLGRTLIGIYLGNSDFTGRYGASGAIIAIVVWIYYSAQILFTGALITRLTAESGSSAVPIHSSPTAQPR